MSENKLNQLLERYQSAKLAEKHLRFLRKRHQEELLRLRQLEAQLDKEYLDYIRLNQLSIRGLFMEILGNKDRQLEIEYQEYLHATLQYNDCLKSVELIEFELEILEEKVAGIANLRLQVEGFLKQKNSSISKDHPQLHRELVDIENSMEELTMLKREIHEAAIVNAKAHQVIFEMLTLIRQEISSDLRWGDFSNRGLLKKGLEERNRMDKVVDLSFKLKGHIKSLQRELDDIYQMKSVTRFNRFNDLETLNEIFYDRLVSDWILSKELSSTFKYLHNADDSLKQISETLKKLLKQADYQIGYLEGKKSKLLNLE